MKELSLLIRIYMDLLNILLWLYVQVLCNLFKGKQIDNLKA